jgi:hypothetical protein
MGSSCAVPVQPRRGNPCAIVEQKFHVKPWRPPSAKNLRADPGGRSSAKNLRNDR